MNERARIEELNDHARRCFRAQVAFLRAEEELSALDEKRSQLRSVVEVADAERAKAWAVYQCAFTAFCRDLTTNDPVRASTIGDVLSWFSPRQTS